MAAPAQQVRSFRGQNIIETRIDDLFRRFYFLFTLLPKKSKAIGRADSLQGGGSSSQVI